MSEKLDALKHELGVNDESASYCCEVPLALKVEDIPDLDESSFS